MPSVNIISTMLNKVNGTMKDGTEKLLDTLTAELDIVENNLTVEVDDGGTSKNVNLSEVKKTDIMNNESNYMKMLLHTNNIYNRNEIRRNLYTGTFRFGLANIYDSIGYNCREYLFFTKPNLNIIAQDDNGIAGSKLNSNLSNINFWQDLYSNKRDIINCLESSCNTLDPFNHMLQNMVQSNLEIPALESTSIDTPSNMYGISYEYRGTSEASDDNPQFSLEFRDTKYLDVYNFFKAYEDYETLKHHGVISPSQYFIVNKQLHDAFSIYKFIVDEDMETILYYGKMYGVTPMSLPRDVFSNPNFDSGLSYSINFKAAFYEDMRPEILGDFNVLSAKYFKSLPYYITPYNGEIDKSDMRVAKAAFVYKDTSSATAKRSPHGYVYKLKWKGDSVL